MGFSVVLLFLLCSPCSSFRPRGMRKSGLHAPIFVLRTISMKRLAATLGALLLAFSAIAQNYPSKPIKLIVPLAAAGTGDTLARAVGEAMAKELGQPVVIENRPGA